MKHFLEINDKEYRGEDITSRASAEPLGKGHGVSLEINNRARLVGTYRWPNLAVDECKRINDWIDKNVELPDPHGMHPSVSFDLDFGSEENDD